jgi:hypothetical protein
VLTRSREQRGSTCRPCPAWCVARCRGSGVAVFAEQWPTVGPVWLASCSTRLRDRGDSPALVRIDPGRVDRCDYFAPGGGKVIGFDHLRRRTRADPQDCARRESKIALTYLKIFFPRKTTAISPLRGPRTPLKKDPAFAGCPPPGSIQGSILSTYRCQFVSWAKGPMFPRRSVYQKTVVLWRVSHLNRDHGSMRRYRALYIVRYPVRGERVK